MVATTVETVAALRGIVNWEKFPEEWNSYLYLLPLIINNNNNNIDINNNINNNNDRLVVSMSDY